MENVPCEAVYHGSFTLENKKNKKKMNDIVKEQKIGILLIRTQYHESSFFYYFEMKHPVLL